MKVFRLTLLTAAVLCGLAFAATPNLLNYQGRLTTPSGTPVIDNTYAVTFSIYSVPSGGTALWTETQAVNTVGGVFSTVLGSTIPLSSGLFSDSTRYLGIKVGADPEIVPRAAMVTVPYAFRVATVDGASGGNISSKVSIGSGHTNTGLNAFVAGESNEVSGTFSSVGGGFSNTASGASSTVGGGQKDTASGSFSTVAGGSHNVASGDGSTVAGGTNNNARGNWSVVGGGGGATSTDSNSAIGDYSTIAGGGNNRASGSNSTVGGGRNNMARGNYSVIGGGGSADPFDSSLASGSYSVVAGGAVNRATGSASTISGGVVNRADGESSTVSGGEFNSAEGIYATVGGGKQNSVSGPRGTVAGGWMCLVTDTGATVGGGSYNRARGLYSVVAGGGSGYAFDSNAALGPYSTVSGGKQNHATVQESAIGGGTFNTASGQASFVGGGSSNRAGGASSVVGGGLLDTASGHYSVVPGGRSNTAWGNYSFAAGLRAKAIHNGAFVWGDETEADFTSTGSNQFLIRAAGGVGIGTTSPGAGLHVKGGGFPRAFGYFDTDASTQDAGLRFYEAGVVKSHLYHQASTNTLNLYGEGYSGISVNSTGNVGIGTTSPTAKLHVVGNICYTGSIGACSDLRYKTDISTLSGSLAKLRQLRGIAYRWKKDEYPTQDFDDHTHIGFIAQEIEKLYPEMVMTDPTGYKSVDYSRLTPVLVEAIKEQQMTIESLTARLVQIESIVNKLAETAKTSGADSYGVR